MKKIKNAFGGIIGGLFLILAAIGLLWWNEGNNVRNLKTIKEASKNVVDISSEKVNASNEGALVATNGNLNVVDEFVSDTMFQVNVKTAKLVRNVEMYQWVEERNEDDDGNVTYEYSKKWLSEVEDSSNYSEVNHDNPAYIPYESTAYYAATVELGAFDLSELQKVSLSTNGKYTFTGGELLPENYSITGSYITNSKNLATPDIGDVRISYVYNNSKEISVMAKQKGNTFVNYVSDAGKTINRVEDGLKSSKEMLSNMQNENNFLKWIIRLIGFILCVAGFGALLKPISAIASFVPILGSIVGAGMALIALVLGLVVSLVTIAVAWIRFRPVLGIGLIIVAAGIITLLILKGKKKKELSNSSNVVAPVSQGVSLELTSEVIEPAAEPTPGVTEPVIEPTSSVTSNPDSTQTENKDQ